MGKELIVFTGGNHRAWGRGTPMFTQYSLHLFISVIITNNKTKTHIK
jgi:hypothetical protein